jgi:hypothetical protein
MQFKLFLSVCATHRITAGSQNNEADSGRPNAAVKTPNQALHLQVQKQAFASNSAQFVMSRTVHIFCL